ncbi:MAG: hypothetical protein E7516_10490 [Ruminococcaceae bacterium]|nr:hypothetical protein [Oscillospiraceae bacterium]
MENSESTVYIKTIREIADEIGVSKQAVFKKINRQPLSTELMGLTSTVDGRLMVSVDGEKLIKQAFGVESEECGCQPSTNTVNHQPSTDNQVDGEVGGFDGGIVGKNQALRSTEKVHEDDSDDKSEVLFLRKQIEQMNDQLSRRDTMIDSLNRELEKEREHNREKDRQLLDTLTKLAETQAALAVGQSAEKQKALAETLIEGQQIMDGEHGESADKAADVYAAFDDEFREEPKKRGVLQRVWDAITGKG